MPRRDDLSTILVIGSGPIVIGQACEFDYSGTQACKALRREGYRVVLVNSNPATIMTDPDLADRTYVEPLTPESVHEVIRRERPDALLPTLGGQTGLNVAVALAETGSLEAEGVRLIGADLATIRRAEDRRLFVETMREAGLPLPRSGFAHSVEEAAEVAATLGYPVMIRPSYALGGGGTGIARSAAELEAVASGGIGVSPIGEVVVEESVEGWKEFELEVMRDAEDQAVIVCSIENLDPMGVHTGDSITVAPAQTLSDRDYQAMRDAALACIRAVGVETGGSNIQFAVDPATGRMVVIEMNPRVSRSSALASKATGFPIAKIAALLAVGYRLDEIANDVTGATPACFEPALDYVVVKIPRWSFEKFPEADRRLSTSMRSVGEVMGIGRTFAEALGKARRSLEPSGAGASTAEGVPLAELGTPTEGRLDLVERALSEGHTVEEVASASGVDPWFVDRIASVAEAAGALRGRRLGGVPAAALLEAKRAGLADARMAELLSVSERELRAARRAAGVRPVFKTVDTCAGEFEARTPYHYSTYERETEVRPGSRPRVVILGSGPNRIGQGIEFDYACVHAAFALDAAGYETVMVNCNPETVSTDYDISARLYFEPLTAEDVLAVCEAEDPVGVIVQLGGQTPLKLAADLEAEGYRVLGTSPSAIDLAEDRGKFGALLEERGILQPPHGEAASVDEAVAAARRIGYPVVVRPSYVLGGRGMEIVYSEDELRGYVEAGAAAGPERPVLIDRFLEGAIEVDVDAVCDGEEVLVAAVMEHIEEAGIHSGDSSCVLPPVTISDEHLDAIEATTGEIAEALGVRGLLNVQFALRDDRVWVLEANPRASRTLPFVSKATGVQVAKVAARVVVGERLADLRAEGMLPAEPGVDRRLPHVAVKAAVLPFQRFPGLDTVLGPEMRSTGEVMGIADELGAALAKAQAATGAALPGKGTVFVSVANRDKRAAVFPIKRLADLGFEVVATRGTARLLARAGVAVSEVRKVAQGAPNAVDLIESGAVDLVVNTPFGRGARGDGYHIRTAAAREGIPCVTTLQGLFAAVQGIEAQVRGLPAPRSLQEYHAHLERGVGSEP